MTRGELGTLGLLAGGFASAAAVAMGSATPALPLACGFAVSTWLTLATAQPGLRLYGDVHTRVAGPGIALTIDDGPDPVTTPRLLDALAAAGARATFFFLGDRAAAFPDLVRRVVTAGHEVGLHGREHSAALTWLGPAAGARWIAEGRAALERAGSGPIRWFRPPFGVVSPRLFASARAAEIEVVWCSIRTGDGVAIAPKRLLRRTGAAAAGDVVLIHDGSAVTAGLLPEILAGWAARGLRVGSFGELAGHGQLA